jgi:hypothetical protein
MPISDYASAFFFAHRDRVTLKGVSTMPRGGDCYFESERDQRSASIFCRRRMLAKHAVLLTMELRQ